MKNYKTIGLALLTLGLAGCGAGIQNTGTDITRMYQGQHGSGCVTISSTAAYNQGWEAFAKSEWGKHIGVGCTADSGDRIDRDIKALDVFDMDTKFVGRVSDHNRAQRLLLKAAEKNNFDYNQQCGLVYSTAAYRNNGTIGLETPLGEQVGLVCNPSKDFIPERDLCRVSGLEFDVYSIESKEYKWIGEASSCKEAQGILKGLKREREE